jgi:hypothetical protein
MRHLHLRLGVWAACAVLGTACGGGDNPTGPGNTSMTAKVDGNTWRATVGVAAVRQAGFIGIGGSAADGSTISFAFPDNGTGTFQVAGTDGTNANYIKSGQGWTAAFGSGGSGTITVTSVTATRVGGTFSFVAQGISGGATGTKTVTNGSFDIAF